MESRVHRKGDAEKMKKNVKNRYWEFQSKKNIRTADYDPVSGMFKDFRSGIF